jgi:hypothetical protein
MLDGIRSERRTPSPQNAWTASIGICIPGEEGAELARRSRFPKNFEREAEVHQRSAEMITMLSPDDV